MPTNNYRFVTRWHVKATPEDVFDLLDTPTDYVRWWPSVWLRAEQIDGGGAGHVGRRVRFLSRGWLPYTLRWTAETVTVSRPSRIEVRASGDFEGRGEWTIHATDASHTEAEYVWTRCTVRLCVRASLCAGVAQREGSHARAMDAS